MSKVIQILTILITVFLIQSCGEQQFATTQIIDSTSISPLQYDSNHLCTGFTHIKPPVDLLFLWDNSGSQYFVDAATKASLANTINYVSQKFDYHVMLAPMIKPDNSDPKYLVTASTDGLTSDAQAMVIPQSSAVNFINFPPAGSSLENGVDRAISLINTNKSNGIFREGAHTIVVLMSNGDDNTYQQNYNSAEARTAFINDRIDQLKSVRDNNLHAVQLRFISLVAFTACQTGFTPSYVYREISKGMYNSTSATGFRPSDQGDAALPDSYNICTTDFNHLFDGINSSITDVLLKHVYNYWPIGHTSTTSFDPGTIEVSKKVNGLLVKKLVRDDPNGFQYVGYKVNQNTKVEPAPAGEPYTGHMVKLNGTARATYPECIVVKTQQPASYYGYVHLHSEPLLASIKLYINGRFIPQSSTNGWEYVGYSSNKNITIKSPTEPNIPGNPGEFFTGYFLKITGNAIYTNGAEIEIHFDPASKD